MDIFLSLVDNGACGGLGPIVKVLKGIISIITIVVPIALLIMGVIDLAKAVLASDEKEIKAATTKLVRRAIAAVAVFFAATLVNVLMGIVGNNDWRECWKTPEKAEVDL